MTTQKAILKITSTMGMMYAQIETVPEGRPEIDERLEPRLDLTSQRPHQREHSTRLLPTSVGQHAYCVPDPVSRASAHASRASRRAVWHGKPRKAHQFLVCICLQCLHCL